MRVLLFAQAAAAVGRDAVDIASATDVAGVRSALLAAHPQLAGVLATCRIAVDCAFAAEDAVVPPDAEIAVIPPVSGG